MDTYYVHTYSHVLVAYSSVCLISRSTGAQRGTSVIPQRFIDITAAAVSDRFANGNNAVRILYLKISVDGKQEKNSGSTVDRRRANTG